MPAHALRDILPTIATATSSLTCVSTHSCPNPHLHTRHTLPSHSISAPPVSPTILTSPTPPDRPHRTSSRSDHNCHPSTHTLCNIFSTEPSTAPRAILYRIPLRHLHTFRVQPLRLLTTPMPHHTPMERPHLLHTPVASISSALNRPILEVIHATSRNTTGHSSPTRIIMTICTLSKPGYDR